MTMLNHKVSSGSTQYRLNSSESTADPVQTRLEWHWPSSFDPLFDDLPPDGLRSAGPPGNLHGGFGMSEFNTGWPLVSNMAEQPVDHYPAINFGPLQTPSINQEFNSLIPLHIVAHQHQWNTGNHCPPSNLPLNNITSLKLFNPTGFSNAVSLVGPEQQSQLLVSIENNQSGAPLSETQMVGGG